jgi:hypothetical protein
MEWARASGRRRQHQEKHTQQASHTDRTPHPWSSQPGRSAPAGGATWRDRSARSARRREAPVRPRAKRHERRRRKQAVQVVESPRHLLVEGGHRRRGKVKIDRPLQQSTSPLSRREQPRPVSSTLRMCAAVVVHAHQVWPPLACCLLHRGAYLPQATLWAVRCVVL